MSLSYRTQLLEVFDALADILCALKQIERPVISQATPPAPAKNAHQPRRPVATLEVGETFFMPGANAGNLLAGDAQRQQQKGTGKKFTVRRKAEDGIYGARVWRLN